MQLQDLKPLLTFVIPVRIDSPERTENLRAALRFLGGLGCRVLVLEADAAPALEGQDWLRPAEYTFVSDAAPVFHRTRYINRLLHMADTDIVAVWDTDVLLAYGQILEAAERVCDGCTLACPYNGQVVMLKKQLSGYVRKSLDLEYLRCLRLHPITGRRFCGGAYLVHRERYLQCGGENERFTGWGPEDMERMHRVRILGHRVEWTGSGQLYHLYHPRGKNSDFQSEADGDRLRRELVKVCCMDKETLEKYIAR